MDNLHGESPRRTPICRTSVISAISTEVLSIKIINLFERLMKLIGNTWLHMLRLILNMKSLESQEDKDNKNLLLIPWALYWIWKEFPPSSSHFPTQKKASGWIGVVAAYKGWWWILSATLRNITEMIFQSSLPTGTTFNKLRRENMYSLSM